MMIHTRMEPNIPTDILLYNLHSEPCELVFVQYVATSDVIQTTNGSYINVANYVYSYIFLCTLQWYDNALQFTILIPFIHMLLIDKQSYWCILVSYNLQLYHVANHFTIKMKCGYHTIGVIHDTVQAAITPKQVWQALYITPH